MKDPNPKVSGRGIRELAGAGIETITGVLGPEAKRLNEAYIKWITTGHPFVTMKVAASLDGKIASATPGRSPSTNITCLRMTDGYLSGWAQHESQPDAL